MPKRLKKPDSIVLFLIHIRLLKKLKQEYVAEKCPSLSLRTLQRIEQGKADLKITQYRELCDCYGITSLDVSLGELRQRPTTAADVSATAKLLPKRVREAFVDLMVAVAEELQEKDDKE